MPEIGICMSAVRPAGVTPDVLGHLPVPEPAPVDRSLNTSARQQTEMCPRFADAGPLAEIVLEPPAWMASAVTAGKSAAQIGSFW